MYVSLLSLYILTNSKYPITYSWDWGYS
jgi:hypothetical protein